MVTPQLRREVLQVYRQIFQLARSWRAVEESETTVERAYIRDEARRLFRKNKNVCTFLVEGCFLQYRISLQTLYYEFNAS